MVANRESGGLCSAIRYVLHQLRPDRCGDCDSRPQVTCAPHRSVSLSQSGRDMSADRDANGARAELVTLPHTLKIIGRQL